MKRVFKIILILCMLLLVGCDVQSKLKASISTNNDEINVRVGDTTKLEILYHNVVDKTLKIEVEDETIVTVDEELNVTALKEGITTVIISLKNHLGPTPVEFTVRVLEKLQDFEITGASEIVIGETSEYFVSIYDLSKITWSTDQQDIIKVSNNQVTALKEGTAILVAEYENVKKEFVIVVKKDQNKPIISYSGKDSIVINWNDTRALLQDVTASDNLDGDLTSKIVINGEFNIQDYGMQTVTYTVTDSSGNESSITRNVEVIWNNEITFIGHAGSYYGIMNTEEAILYAIQVLKYQAVEVDLKQTKDGVFVLCHDDTFGDYNISSTDWDVLKDVEITKSRSGGYPSQNGTVVNSPYTSKICSLERFLDICKEYGVKAVIELKSSKGITNSDQSRMQALMDVITTKDMLNDIIFLGSQYNCLIWTRNNGYNDVECQYLVNSCESEIYLNRCIEYDLDISINVTGNYSNSDEWLARYKEAGLKISTYTYTQWVNYDAVQTWINKGVDYVTCDWHKMDKLVLPVLSNEPVVFHNVVFKDSNGLILKEAKVQDGKTAAAPINLSKAGYEFIGWDNELTNIQEDTIFTAIYQPTRYSITYDSNLTITTKINWETKDEFTNELYCDLFEWIKANQSKITGMSVNSSVYTFVKNGKTVTFGSVEDIIAIDIYDFELTLAHLFYKPVTRSSDGTVVIVEDENYFLNSNPYRIKYQEVDTWLYNCIKTHYTTYDDTYTPTAAGKIQIFFRMHQWVKGTTIKEFDNYPQKYLVTTRDIYVQMPTDISSYTIEDEVILPTATGDVKFLGWYLTSDYSGEPISIIEKGTTGNIMLYAKWELE